MHPRVRIALRIVLPVLASLFIALGIALPWYVLHKLGQGLASDIVIDQHDASSVDAWVRASEL